MLGEVCTYTNRKKNAPKLKDFPFKMVSPGNIHIDGITWTEKIIIRNL